MKKAFTMIELIFVIVILGILAAIAVPKIGGVREKAELVKASTNFVTAINDMVINASLNNGVLKDDSATPAPTGDPQKVTNALGRSGDGKDGISVGSEDCLWFQIQADGAKAEVVLAKEKTGSATNFTDKCALFFKENAVKDVFMDATISAANGYKYCEIDLLTGRIKACGTATTVSKPKTP